MGRGDSGTWKVLMQPPMADTMIPTAVFGFFQQFKINYLHDRRCIAAVYGLLRFLRGVSRYHHDPRPLLLLACFAAQYSGLGIKSTYTTQAPKAS